MRIFLALLGGLIALLSLTGGIAFALYALYQGLLLQPEVVPWVAALLTACAAFASTILVALVVCWWWRIDNSASRRGSRQGATQGINGIEHWLEASLSPELRYTLRRNVRGAALTALVLGVTVGGSREARRTVMQILRDLNRQQEE